MKLKKLSWQIALFMLLTFATYSAYKAILPVKIIDIHKDQNRRYLVVDNFPYTDRGKLNWWLSNKQYLEESYGIPELQNDDIHSVVIWGIGDGYEIEERDRSTFFPSRSTDHLFCFYDMKVEARCVRKENWKMGISAIPNNRISFSLGDSRYYQDQSGNIKKSR